MRVGLFILIADNSRRFWSYNGYRNGACLFVPVTVFAFMINLRIPPKMFDCCDAAASFGKFGDKGFNEDGLAGAGGA